MLMVWLTIMAALFLLPVLLGVMLPEIKLLIAVVLILAIYSFIRQFFGDGIITLILTAAAAYCLVYKHFWVTATIWWVHIILATFAFSAIGWTFVAFSKIFQGKRV